MLQGILDVIYHSKMQVKFIQIYKYISTYFSMLYLLMIFRKKIHRADRREKLAESSLPDFFSCAVKV